MRKYINRCLLIFLLVILSGCREELVRNLHDHEMRKIAGVLAEAGIQSNRKRHPDNLWSIEVDSGATVAAMQLVEQYRLIDSRPNEEKEDSLFISAQEQHLRYQQSISRHIENTLRTLDGVLDAKVMMTLPQADALLAQNPKSGSGSVLLIGTTDLMITSSEIQQLVAGAAGLPADNIHVLIKPGKLSVLPLQGAHTEVVSLLRVSGGTTGCLLVCAGLFLIVKKKRTKREAGYGVGMVVQ